MNRGLGIGVIVPRVFGFLLPVLAVSGSGEGLEGQTASRAPVEATALVVRVVSLFWDDPVPQLGAGIIVGADAQRIYVTTAAHVVRRDVVASSVVVSFASHPTDSVVATPLDSIRRNMDVAVLMIRRDALPRGTGVPAFDRLGSVADMRFGDGVSPMGCPQGTCWEVPVPADRIVGIDRQGIIFQSSFVTSGSSGGSLFNRWWEVVGMVTEDAPPRANAIPIDQVLALAKTWGCPVLLRRATVPRTGYRTHFGLTLLAAATSDADTLSDLPGRLPSGRVVMTRQGQSSLIWHLSALRLAPRNRAVDAAMGGVGLNLHVSRFAAQPFLELGFGRVEGRYDAGGYYVASDGHQPLWQEQRKDGVGVGGGMSVQILIAPHIVLEALGGHWSFNMPDSLPKLPDFFIGAGLRLGL